MSIIRPPPVLRFYDIVVFCRFHRGAWISHVGHIRPKFCKFYTNLSVHCLKWRFMIRHFKKCIAIAMTSHERHVVPNHQSLDCLFNSLSGSTSKPALLVLYEGNSPVTHKGPVTRKKLPFDDVIMPWPTRNTPIESKETAFVQNCYGFVYHQL